MLIKSLKFVLAICGGITGFTIVTSLEYEYFSNYPLLFKIVIYVVISALFALLFYVISGKVLLHINKFFGRAERSVKHLSLYDIIVSLAGLLIGVAVASLLSIPVKDIHIIGPPIMIIIYLFCGLCGMYILYKKREEITFINFKGLAAKESVKLIDTCVIIDGRLNDIIKTGFIKGPFLVPNFILMELQMLADSNDDSKRSKGKRGLDLLEQLKKDSRGIIIKDTEFDRMKVETDVKLIKYAQKHKCTILTLDFNLNKVAAVTGIKVLNINDLSSSLKASAIPGDKIFIEIQKKGKEIEQGIGYLEDGTMVIIENGRKYIGNIKEVLVTSVTQTSAGRLIFTRIE